MDLRTKAVEAEERWSLAMVAAEAAHTRAAEHRADVVMKEKRLQAQHLKLALEAKQEAELFSGLAELMILSRMRRGGPEDAYDAGIDLQVAKCADRLARVSRPVLSVHASFLLDCALECQTTMKEDKSWNTHAHQRRCCGRTDITCFKLLRILALIERSALLAHRRALIHVLQNAAAWLQAGWPEQHHFEFIEWGYLAGLVVTLDAEAPSVLMRWRQSEETTPGAGLPSAIREEDTEEFFRQDQGFELLQSNVQSTLQGLKSAEARVKMAKWRASCRARHVAMYWLEVTQKKLCAPGGRGRLEDLAGFEADVF